MKVIKNRGLIKSIVFVLFWMYAGCTSDSGTEETPPIDNNGNGNTSAATIQMEFDQSYAFIYSDSKVKDRNFYWTTIIENDNNAKSALENNDDLKTFLLNAKQRVSNLVGNNNLTAAQYADALKFSDGEKITISLAIKDILMKSGSAFNELNKNHIEPSGVFNHFKTVTDASRVHQLIVEEILLGINQIIDTYCAGLDPRYPNIDAVSFDVNGAQYKLLLNTLVSDLNNNKDQYKLFYEPFLKFALGVLELNDRDEAGRYFLIQNSENKAAYDYLQTINWNDFDYSMIVVLGDSPNSSGDEPNISIGGKVRADHGVELYNQGKAPLIAFTGGHLWPVHTIYSEAIEMKKYVMEKYSIPENRILVDPHARHTTTNMRNIGRQIFRYGIPIDKKAIVSARKTHSEYVASSGYLTRCENEMGHIPLKLYERLSDFDLEFTSLIEVLHLDSSDPLDP
jgi:hypothetical protein